MRRRQGSTANIRTEGRILRLGSNCWRIAEARRAVVLIDAAAYFRHLEDALRRARRSIIIVGWDFDARITLSPEGKAGTQMRLSDLFWSLVEQQPALEIRILVWDFSVFYAPGDPISILLGADWQDHPRISLHLDRNHPLGGAHHQKIVSIDDAVAFSGGIDLTVDRWDTPGHAAVDPLRVTPDGESYGPIHDLQMAVDGEAASAVAAVARDRWQRATGETLPPISTGDDPWPKGLAADFVDVPVAVSRTIPARDGAPAVHEVAALACDAIRAARHFVYIETQYFTGANAGDCLAERLAAPDAPEVVVITTETTHGLVERFIMGGNRDRFIRRLKHADRFDRLRVYHPVVPADDRDQEVLVHAKLIVVDDAFVRVGSSNLNNRSVGLDTECDLAVEARDDPTRQATANLRNRLLAEHLGASPEAVRRAIAAEGSLIRAIDQLNRGPRGLCPFSALTDDGPERPVPGTKLLDPEEPFEPLFWLHHKRER